MITSTQNKTIKEIVKLQSKSKERRKQGLFIIEGLRELKLAQKANYQIQEIFIYPELISEEINELFSNLNTTEVSKEVYEKIAYRSTTEGVLAIAKSKNHNLNELQLNTDNPLILVAEAPEKPGNIGAILRTADAAKVDAVIIANPKTDVYNPNIIRSSVGCVFTNTIAVGTTSEIIQFLKKKEISIYSAILQESELYTTQNFTKPTAIVVGTEDAGLSEEWRINAKQNIHIPMQGEIDSMNVSVAAGILIFEAKRQRDFN